MSTYFRFLFLFPFAFLLLNSCRDADISPAVDQQFHVYHKQYYIPVQVRGNTASGKIILYVQGGPGMNTLDFAHIDYPGWRQTLEKEYAVAYYDQRGLGNRQGKFNPDHISTQDWIEDIHAVCRILQQKYEAEIYLLGHSYGGYLTMRYMLHYGQKGIPIKYINVSGPATTDADSALRWQLRYSFLENIVQEELSTNSEKEYWQTVNEWLKAHPVLDTAEEYLHWNTIIEEQIASRFEEKMPSLNDYLSVLLFSSYNAPTTFLNGKVISTLEKNLLTEANGFKLAEKLSQLTSPLLVISGRYDDVLPPEEVAYIMNGLGAAQKKSVIIPSAGHEVYIDQPQLFYQAVKEFIQ